MWRPLVFGAGAVLVVALVACDFGTLDDLSEDQAAAGSSETSRQALDLWTVYEKPDDDVKKAVADIAGVIERAGGRPYQVTIDHLTKDKLGIPNATRDPSAAQGMLVITDLDCSLDQIAKYASAKNQTEIYPDKYDKYQRDYQGNIQDFLSGAAPTIVWKTSYTVSLLSRTYQAQLTGGLRFVAGAAPGGQRMLLARTILDQPATFTAGGDAEFNQDYQVEAFYETAPNRVVHYYAIWREFRIGSLTSSDNLYINVILGNSVDFDQRTSIVCKKNNPLPKFE